MTARRTRSANSLTRYPSAAPPTPRSAGAARSSQPPLPHPSQFGQITSLSYKQGFAFIDYADQRDAQDAIMSMNQKQLAGRTITVELSGRPPKDGKPPPRHGDSYDRGPPRYDDRSDQRGSFGGAGRSLKQRG